MFGKRKTDLLRLSAPAPGGIRAPEKISPPLRVGWKDHPFFVARTFRLGHAFIAGNRCSKVVP